MLNMNKSAFINILVCSETLWDTYISVAKQNIDKNKLKCAHLKGVRVNMLFGK